jgi:hypothetical protein
MSEDQPVQEHAPGEEEERHQSPDQDDARHGEDYHQPEPQKHVDLLVDDVESHHAQRVVDLDGPRGTVLVEGALGHFGENLLEDVRPVAYHFGSQGVELVP